LPLLALLWNYLNAMLSLAPVFVVRDAASAGSSIALAARAFREHRASLLGTAALFALLRIVAMGALLAASLMVVATFSSTGFKATMAVLILLTLGYSLVVDFLYIARLAATVEICTGEETPEPMHAPIAPPSPVSPPPLPVEVS